MRLLLIALLALAPLAGAQEFVDYDARRAELLAHAEVESVQVVDAPARVSGAEPAVWRASVKCLRRTGNTGRIYQLFLWVFDYNTANEDAIWDNPPAWLYPPDPPEQVATKAEILNYVNTTFAALNLEGVQVHEIMADAARVSAYFPVTVNSTTKRERREYLLFRNESNQIVAQELVSTQGDEPVASAEGRTDWLKHASLITTDPLIYVPSESEPARRE